MNFVQFSAARVEITVRSSIFYLHVNIYTSMRNTELQDHANCDAKTGWIIIP